MSLLERMRERKDYTDVVTREFLTQSHLSVLKNSVIGVAVLFAVLGHVEEAVELLTISYKNYPFEASDCESAGLSFAFEITDIWPEFVPVECRSTEHLSNIAEFKSSIYWGCPYEYFQLSYPTGGSTERPPFLSRDEGTLRVLLDRIFERTSEKEFLYSKNEKHFEKLDRVGMILLALEIALQLGEHQDEVEVLLDIMRQDLLFYIPLIAQSRVIWSIILTEGTIPSASKKSLLPSFEEVKSALVTRYQGGQSRPFKDNPLRSLLEALDRNTQAHNDEEDKSYMYTRDANYRSISIDETGVLHHPATKEEITALEARLKITLPEDYKAFLSCSNGLNSVWNGYYHQQYLTTTELVKKASDTSWQTTFGNDTPIFFELLPFEDFPRGTEVDWPNLELDKMILLASEEDIADDTQIFLIYPELVKRAVSSFFSTYEKVDDGIKPVLEQIALDWFGGLDNIRQLQWVVFTWTGEGIGGRAFGSFRAFLEDVVLRSERNEE